MPYLTIKAHSSVPASTRGSSDMDVALAGEIATAAVIPVFARIADLDTAWFENLAEPCISTTAR